MALDERVAGVLAEAERKLGELAEELLREREYAAVQQLSALMARVAALTTEVTDAAATRMAAHASVAGPLAATAGDGDFDSAASEDGGAVEAGRHQSYPRFFREDDQIVKIGFSKTDRRTYEHRSPRSVLVRLAEVIGEVGGRGRRFTTEQLLPPRARQLAGVPAYQIYLCLGFLIRQALVQRHGRAGYSVRAQVRELHEAVERAWTGLAAR